MLWKTQSRLPVCRPTFKPGASRIQNRTTNNSTATFGCLRFCFFRQLFVACNCVSHSSTNTNTSCFLGHQCDFIPLIQTASIPSRHRPFWTHCMLRCHDIPPVRKPATPVRLVFKRLSISAPAITYVFRCAVVSFTHSMRISHINRVPKIILCLNLYGKAYINSATCI